MAANLGRPRYGRAVEPLPRAVTPRLGRVRLVSRSSTDHRGPRANRSASACLPGYATLRDERIERREEGEAVEVRVAGVDLANAVLAHEDGGLGVVHQVAAQAS